MSSSIDVAVLGATGRMGRALLALLAEADDLRLCGALTSPDNECLGMDAGAENGWQSGVALSADPAAVLDGAQVAIDFTLSSASALVLDACLAARCPLVTGVTGHDPALLQRLSSAAADIPIVQAPNMSAGVNLIRRLAALAAASLGADYDVEIIETHHRHKKDAPSGTALHLGEAIAAARGDTLEQSAEFARFGQDAQRVRGGIGFASLRAGEIVGEHSILFAGEGERIEITHRALTRATFAAGALRAARWVVGRTPGHYGMDDVLGLGPMADTIRM